MLIAWMVYAVALTTIVAGLAIALDRLAEIWGFARRPIWLAALAIGIVVPVALALRPVQLAPAASPATLTPDSVRLSVVALPSGGRTPDFSTTHELFLKRFSRPPLLPAFWNRLAGAGWIVASVVLAGLLFRGIVVLYRGRTRWSRSVVDGHPVLLTNDVGPAVVGVLRPTILLPAWALALAETDRLLMLEHEAEHVRARDPILIALAAWSIALFPWNPAIWFVVKRLRLAIEIDCDRRVLGRRSATARDYGLLLLTVGARSASGLRFAASLAEPRRFLEQRIVAMTTARPSRPVVASAPFVAIALLAAVAVAQTPRPDSTLNTRRAPSRVALRRDSVRVEAPPRLAAAVAPVRKPRVRAPQANPPIAEPPRFVSGAVLSSSQPLSIDVVRAWIAIRHPNVIAGDPHVNAVTIVVDENNNLLASVTDSLESVGVGIAPSIMVRGKLLADSVEVVRPVRRPPVIYVDGVRVDSTAQLDTIRIESVEVLKGKSAAAEYGPEAENGIIVIRAMKPDPTQLRRLGISPDNVKEMTELRLRPGVIGPNRLYVAVLQLRKH
jgi:hypothetical protein